MGHIFGSELSKKKFLYQPSIQPKIKPFGFIFAARAVRMIGRVQWGFR